MWFTDVSRNLKYHFILSEKHLSRTVTRHWHTPSVVNVVTVYFYCVFFTAANALYSEKTVEMAARWADVAVAEAGVKLFQNQIEVPSSDWLLCFYSRAAKKSVQECRVKCVLFKPVWFMISSSHICQNSLMWVPGKCLLVAASSAANKELKDSEEVG